MKIDVENKIVTKGMFSKVSYHDVQVSFQLSEEEKAIIKTRGLQERIIMKMGGPASHDPREASITFETLLDGAFWTDFSTPSDAKEFQDELIKKLKQAKEFLKANETDAENISLEI